jgi:DedD protein
VTSNLKQRLVGAFVLAAIAVIFLPSFVKENQPYRVDQHSRVPVQPDITPIRFNPPETPQDIEPAPAPETMFLSADERQPVADSLAELQERQPARVELQPAAPESQRLRGPAGT